jgi:hypothetical protein
VNEGLQSANRILRGMARRAMTNKLITLCIAISLLAGIVLILYLKFAPDAPAETTTVMPTMAGNATTTIASNATTTSTTTLAAVTPPPNQ